LLILQNL